MIRLLYRTQIFVDVSRSHFLLSRYEISTRWRGGLVGQTWVTTQKSYNFWSDCWIALKFLQVFPEAIFLGVAMESLLSDQEVWLGHTRVKKLKGHNLCSDRWIVLKFLQEFPETAFVGAAKF